MKGSSNPELIRYNNLKPTPPPVKFVDALFPVYNQKKVGIQKTTSLISTEDLLKWSNKKAIHLWMSNTLYPSVLMFTNG